MEIRVLDESHLVPYRTLRLHALATEPEAFLHTPEDEVSAEEMRARLAGRTPRAEGFVLGAFAEDGELVGVAGVYREPTQKLRHKGHVWGMYVLPERRSRGLGGRLLDAAIARAPELEGVTWLQLGVTANNPARALYEGRGFRAYGVEPEAIRVEGRTVDEVHMALRLA